MYLIGPDRRAGGPWWGNRLRYVELREGLRTIRPAVRTSSSSSALVRARGLWPVSAVSMHDDRMSAPSRFTNSHPLEYLRERSRSSRPHLTPGCRSTSSSRWKPTTTALAQQQSSRAMLMPSGPRRSSANGGRHPRRLVSVLVRNSPSHCTSTRPDAADYNASVAVPYSSRCATCSVLPRRLRRVTATSSRE